jgi:transcriptional regulator with XRE-family HTH domain
MARDEAAKFCIGFGGRLKARRLFLGHTQEQVAALANMTVQQLRRYETGATEPQAYGVFLLVRALQCEADWLLGRGEDTDRQGWTLLLADQSIAAIMRRLKTMTKPERKRIHALIIAASGSGK